MKSNGSFEDAISGEPILAASSGSWDQSDVLQLLRQDSSQSEGTGTDYSPHAKKNPGLLKGKFKAAIKSLQCSPRVEGDNEKQKDKHTKKNNNMLPPTSTTEPLNDLPQQPVFIANFDEFESMNEIANAPLHLETGSVSSALELEKVLDRLDTRSREGKNDIILNHDNLEIFTNNTTDTDDTNDNDDNNNNNNTDDQDKKSDVIQDLWNVSDPPLQFGDDNEDSVNPTNIKANAFPLSEWESPPSPEPLIQKELSRYSQDSNDTPRTCNKSLILTPKNQERLSIESVDNEDLFGKPPKELFHRSLSLGDSLSPTEDDSPGISSGESHPSSLQQQQTQQQQHYKYESLDTLNLPAMNSRRKSAGNQINLMVQQIENSRRHSSENNKNSMVQPMEENVTTKILDRSTSNSPQSEGSPLSSTVSSFVFSNADGNQAKPQQQQQQRRRVVSPEATSPGFCWKTHPKGDDQRQPPAPAHSKPEIPTSPSFFWKTHPRVTIKSYHYQQVPVRRVNSKLGSNLHLAEVAT